MNSLIESSAQAWVWVEQGGAGLLDGATQAACRTGRGWMLSRFQAGERNPVPPASSSGPLAVSHWEPGCNSACLYSQLTPPVCPGGVSSKGWNRVSPSLRCPGPYRGQSGGFDPNGIGSHGLSSPTVSQHPSEGLGHPEGRSLWPACGQQ